MMITINIRDNNNLMNKNQSLGIDKKEKWINQKSKWKTELQQLKRELNNSILQGINEVKRRLRELIGTHIRLNAGNLWRRTRGQVIKQQVICTTRTKFPFYCNLWNFCTRPKSSISSLLIKMNAMKIGIFARVSYM